MGACVGGGHRDHPPSPRASSAPAVASPLGADHTSGEAGSRNWGGDARPSSVLAATRSPPPLRPGLRPYPALSSSSSSSRVSPLPPPPISSPFSSSPPRPSARRLLGSARPAGKGLSRGGAWTDGRTGRRKGGGAAGEGDPWRGWGPLRASRASPSPSDPTGGAGRGRAGSPPPRGVPARPGEAREPRPGGEREREEEEEVLRAPLPPAPTPPPPEHSGSAGLGPDTMRLETGAPSR